MKKILYISRNLTRCGVHDYGERIVNILKKSSSFKFVFGYPNNRNDMLELIAKYNPQAIIYNYHNAPLYWLNQSFTGSLEIPQIIIYHEFSVAFQPHGICVVDPTMIDDPKNNLVALPRPLHDHIVHKNVVKFDKPTIGSFGFGFSNKNFPEIARLVKDQFDKAIIRLNIPFAEFGDNEGYSAKEEVRKIENILEGTNIELEISHEFLDPQDIFDFLSNNDINLFLYDIMPSKSISGATDYALSVKKPIGLSRSNMFNHFHKYNLDIYVDSTPIKNIIDKGVEQLEPMYNEHCNSNILEKIENVLNTAFSRFKGDIL
jgi:hypothetical protein